MGDVLVKVENVSKRFCGSLIRSFWYGMQDLGPRSAASASRLVWPLTISATASSTGRSLGLEKHSAKPWRPSANSTAAAAPSQVPPLPDQALLDFQGPADLAPPLAANN